MVSVIYIWVSSVIFVRTAILYLLNVFNNSFIRFGGGQNFVNNFLFLSYSLSIAEYKILRLVYGRKPHSKGTILFGL